MMTARNLGWVEATRAPSDAVAEAVFCAAAWVRKDLSLPELIVRFFEAGPKMVIDPRDPDIDLALVALNLNPSLEDEDQETLLGKAHAPTSTVWVRAGCSPVLTAALVIHEARHVWQYVTDMGDEDRWEKNAREYMWPPLVELGFIDTEIRQARHEAAKALGADDGAAGVKLGAR